jgi:ABC-type dipeptide/oligopeptide/nickel transport system permease component
MASIARLARASCLEVFGEGFVLTARSKGLRERTVLGRHVLRNSLIPVITIIGIDLAATLSNAMVIEVVFARPGLGRLVLSSIYHKDFPAVQSIVMLISLAYVLANIFVDVTYTFLDPRIRASA